MPSFGKLFNCGSSEMPQMDDRQKPGGLMSAKQSDADTIDYYDLVFDYVRKFPFASEVKNRINFEKLSPADVNEANLKMYNLPVSYEESKEKENGDQGLVNGEMSNNSKLSKHKSRQNILFSSVFTNSTTATQTHNLRTERRTTSSCSLIISKAITKEGEIKLEIAPPNMMIQANGGFRKEVALQNDKETTLEEEIVWSLDTEVIVPAGSKTRVDLVINEDKYDGYFRIDTVIDGRMVVLLRDKKTNEIVTPMVINDLKLVFKPEDGFRPCPGKPNAVYFVNEGKCSCQFGVSQRVDLTEEKL